MRFARPPLRSRRPTMKRTLSMTRSKRTVGDRPIVSLGILLLLALMVSAAATAQPASLPADAATAKQRLDASPRHGEWVDVEVRAAATQGTESGAKADRVRAWVSYPERSTKAPVVVVIHEIFGLTDWVRAVADQLAADGFIAIAPDLLTGHGPDGGG